MLLILFFTFDAVVSYIAVTLINGKEADLMIAFAVEKYPLLYFVTIPGLIIIMNLIVLGLTKLPAKLFNNLKIKEEVFENIILTALVIHWPIANSFMNLMFMTGHRLTIPDWYKLTLFGLVLGIIYFIYTLKVYKSS